MQILGLKSLATVKLCDSQVLFNMVSIRIFRTSLFTGVKAGDVFLWVHLFGSGTGIGGVL